MASKKNIFDDDYEPPASNQTPPARSKANIFDDDERTIIPRFPPTETQPGDRLPPGFKPFGELKPSPTPTLTNYLKQKGQDLLMAGGMNPYSAGHLSRGAVDTAGISPVGTIFGLGDLAVNATQGNVGAAAIDALSTVPVAGSAVRAVRGQPQIRPAFTPPPWARVESPKEVAAINAGARSWVTPSTGELSGRGIPGDPILGTAQRSYEAIRTAPVAFHPDTGPWLGGRIEQHIQSPTGGAFNRASAPGVYSTVDDNVRAWAEHGGPVTASDLETLRRQLRNLPPDQSAAGRNAAGLVENFMAAPPHGSVMWGTPQDQSALRANTLSARGDYRAGETAEAVERSIDRAGTRAGTTYSGQNLGNRTAQNIEQLAAVNPITGRSRLFGATPDELATVTAASQPGWLDNRRRYLGNFFGGGGGMHQFIASGGMGGVATGAAHALGADPFTAAMTGLAATGATMKGGSDLTRAYNEGMVRRAEDAAAAIRRNSPEFRARAADPTNAPLSDPRSMLRDAIAYAMMPQVRQSGENAWNQEFVPYANR